MLFYIEIVVILRFWLIVKCLVLAGTRILDNKLVFKGTLPTNPLIIWSLYDLQAYEVQVENVSTGIIRIFSSRSIRAALE